MRNRIISIIITVIFILSLLSGITASAEGVQITTDVGGSISDAYEIENGVLYSSAFDGENDYDYYKFTTESYNAFYNFEYVYQNFSGLVRLFIYSYNGEPVSSYSATAESFTYNFKLPSNSTYYIAFNGSGVGDYQLKISPRADDYGDTYLQAQSIQYYTRYNASFDGTHDSDYFSFSTGDVDKFFYVEYVHHGFSGTVYVNIEDVDHNIITTKSATATSFDLNVKLKKYQTCYIRFYADGVGDYEFRLIPKDDPYPDSFESAPAITLNTENETAFEGNGDSDFIKFTTVEYNADYDINYVYQDVDANVTAYLYDEQKTEIARREKASESFTLTKRLEPNSVYYVKFSSDGIGNYKFNIKQKNDDTTPLTMGKAFNSSLETSKDHDWYKIDIKESTNLLVTGESKNVSGLYFEVYDNHNTRIIYSGYVAAGEYKALSYKVDAGTCYIKVFGVTAGDYTLTVSPCGSGHSYKNGTCLECGAKEPFTPPVFKDVKSDSWYKEAVDFSVKNGLFNGTSDTTFEPNTPMTRAMLVTVLWRYAGEPSGSKNKFSDVESGKWYTDAIAWAAHYGIVDGIGDGKFNPSGNITREQMAAILYRYASKNGINTSKRAYLSLYPDYSDVSSWAEDAMRWAVAKGFITGTTKSGVNGTVIDPKGNATRAQVATILMRFINDIE